MNAKRRIIVRIALSTCAAFATVFVLGAIVGLRLNIASNSLPPGLYRIAPRGKGSDLLICPTGIAESISISRGYRPKGAGCGDGYAPLLKPISARYGDTVTVSSAGIAINGRLLSELKAIPERRTQPAIASSANRNVPGPARNRLGDLFLQPLQLRQPILRPNTTR